MDRRIEGLLLWLREPEPYAIPSLKTRQNTADFIERLTCAVTLLEKALGMQTECIDVMTDPSCIERWPTGSMPAAPRCFGCANTESLAAARKELYP